MTATYRPGQLYTCAEGDLLFVVLAPSERIAFVTNRSTIIDVEHVERVYAPLTLVRDVDGPPAGLSEDVRVLAAAIREVLDVPVAADYDEQRLADEVMRLRAATVRGVLKAAADYPTASLTAMLATLTEATAWYPVTHAPHLPEPEPDRDITPETRATLTGRDTTGGDDTTGGA